MDFFFLCRKSRQKYGIFLFASHLSYIPMEARQKVVYLCSVIYYKKLIKYDLLLHPIDPAFELLRIFVETSLLEIDKDIVNKINWKVLVLRQKICILNFKNWQPVTADFKVSRYFCYTNISITMLENYQRYIQNVFSYYFIHFSISNTFRAS